MAGDVFPPWRQPCFCPQPIYFQPTDLVKRFEELIVDLYETRKRASEDYEELERLRAENDHLKELLDNVNRR